MRTVILMLIFASVSSAVFGQKEKKKILDGNKEYKAEQYENAEELYEESLSGKETPEALYNFGNALYRQGEFEKAAETFLRVTQSETASDELKSKAYHNLGNSYMSQEQVQKGADAYKDGLRKNPKDEDTRHNLSYALRQLQQMKEESSSEKNGEEKKGEEGDQEENGQQEGEGDQDGDEEGESQKPGDENDNGQREGEDQNENGKPSNEEGQEVPNEISKEDAARILNSLNQNEQKIQEQVRKKRETRDEKVEKDW
jgi:tetratricopeptide (TPR) repeat protein